MQSGVDTMENLSHVISGMDTAVAQGAELVVFPEATMRSFGGGRLDTIAEPLDGPFATLIRDHATELGVIAVVGMFSPADTVDKDGTTRNRVANMALVTGPDVHESYQKIHTYDAFGYRESDTVAPGTDLMLFDAPSARVGVAICYDIRFPEQFINLAKLGAEVIVVPASWQDGPGKLDQWRTLVTARALDSTSFIIAADQARPGGETAAGHDDGPTGIGHSAVSATSISPTFGGHAKPFRCWTGLLEPLTRPILKLIDDSPVAAVLTMLCCGRLSSLFLSFLFYNEVSPFLTCAGFATRIAAV